MRCSGFVRCLVAFAFALLPCFGQGTPKPQEWLARATAALEAGKLDSARTTIENALAAYPNHPLLLSGRAQVYLAEGKPDLAFADLSRAIEGQPDLTQAYWLRAGLLMDRRDFAAAGADLDAYIKRVPKQPNGHFLNTLVLFLKGDMKGTVASANKYLALDSGNPIVFTMRAMGLYQTGQLRDALMDLNGALSIESDYPIAYFVRGKIYEALNQPLFAEDDLKIARALEPSLTGIDFPTPAQAEPLLLAPAPQRAARYCSCCVLFNDKGLHEEGRVQAELARQKTLQLGTQSKFKVFKDFTFNNQLIRSRIGFLHKSTDDSARDWKPVHYDHGNSLTAADVDGDGLLDLLFLSQLGPNELWRNTGGGVFENITEKSGIAMADRMSVAASFADADNDGDPDLYITTVKMGNVFFENTGKGVFRDITKAAGLEHKGHSSGIMFFDYNNDGLLDLLVTNVGVYTFGEKGRGGFYLGLTDAFAGHLKPERAERSLLYRNQGGLKFIETGNQAKFLDDSWSGDATFADLNRDGFPDVFLGNMQGDDHYYENLGGTEFKDSTKTYFSQTPWGTMGMHFFDYNNDGRLDLYLTDMHSDMSINVRPQDEKKKSHIQWPESFLQSGGDNLYGNAFYQNTGQNPLLEISDLIGAENYWPWGISVADLNADGFEDVFVASSMNYPFRYAINSVLLNNRGESLLDSEFLLGVEPRTRSIKPLFVLDCAGADGDHPRCKDQTGTFVMWSAYGSRTSLVWDLDDDGDLDIVTSEFNSEPQVLISNLAEKQKVNYLKIKLVGSKSNRDGLGATLTVKCGDTVQTRYHNGKSGYLSQSAMPLYLGLGSAARVDEITVKWPSGAQQKLAGPIAVNRLIEIAEPK